jgi:hypothetical protein
LREGKYVVGYLSVLRLNLENMRRTYSEAERFEEGPKPPFPERKSDETHATGVIKPVLEKNKRKQ